MRFDTVFATAFGPLRGQRLDFAPGMNLIHGPNEAGKSSWHSALYVSLCGVRRGAGARRDDRVFAMRHKPWLGSDWLVGAHIRLDNGRSIEMSHDLAGRIDCFAKDAVTGSECSAEIMNEGNPDGSRWLG